MHKYELSWTHWFTITCPVQSSPAPWYQTPCRLLVYLCLFCTFWTAALSVFFDTWPVACIKLSFLHQLVVPPSTCSDKVGYLHRRGLTAAKNKTSLIVKGQIWHDSYLTSSPAAIGSLFFPPGRRCEIKSCLGESSIGVSTMGRGSFSSRFTWSALKWDNMISWGNGLDLKALNSLVLVASFKETNPFSALSSEDELKRRAAKVLWPPFRRWMLFCSSVNLRNPSFRFSSASWGRFQGRTGHIIPPASPESTSSERIPKGILNLPDAAPDPRCRAFRSRFFFLQLLEPRISLLHLIFLKLCVKLCRDNTCRTVHLCENGSGFLSLKGTRGVISPPLVYSSTHGLRASLNLSL